MPDGDFDMIWREGVPPSEGDYPGLDPRTEVDEEHGIVCEYDASVELRDGTTIYADVFRPEGQDDVPALVGWGPYGKHDPVSYDHLAGSHMPDSRASDLCIFEAPDPAYWCKHGYAIVYPDPRGAWGSEGDLTFMTKQEARDCYDLIEWIPTQEWSNGKVGMSGVSYLAWIQWGVAELDPPHLEAINPWEGVSDFYREYAFHGGIPAGFVPWIINDLWPYTSNRLEDLEALQKEHPLNDAFWASKYPDDLSQITTPAYVGASWSDQGLHTRGTLRAFEEISSDDKWLTVHGRKKWPEYYDNEDRVRQFFDKYLKETESEVDHWPTVNLEIREAYKEGNYREETTWPLERTQNETLYLDAQTNALRDSAVDSESTAVYDSEVAPEAGGKVQFEHEFENQTEITGTMKLKLWVEADGSDDMDLFVIVDKLNHVGERVRFPVQGWYDEGSAAYGWLRVSHRELDQERSEPNRPVHTHESEEKLDAGEIVPVEIEVWPSSTVFDAGESIRLTVAGDDFQTNDASWQHPELVNEGRHIIHTGGEYDSHLVAPVLR